MNPLRKLFENAFKRVVREKSLTVGKNKYMPHDGAQKAERERAHFEGNPNYRCHALRMNAVHKNVRKDMTEKQLILAANGGFWGERK